MSPSAAIAPTDDLRHAPDSDASDWSESWVFYAIAPEHEFCCLTRIGLAPNKGTCNIAVCMSRAGKPLYHRYLDRLPLPEGDLTDGISAGGLTFKALSLEERHFAVSFVDPATPLALDFEWRGAHEPVDAMGLHVPGGTAGLSSMHLEQLGHVSGHLNLRGEALELSGVGPRDHSLGTRDWESIHSYDLGWVLMDDGRAFGLIEAQGAKGIVQIPWLWDGERTVPLSGMRFEKTLDADDRPLSVTIDVADPSGRRYRLDGTRRTSLPCFIDGYVVHSGYFDFVLDDDVHGVGAEEYGYRMGAMH